MVINRTFNTIITTDTSLVLAMALDASNLLVPPSVLATTPAATILATLRERLTRFRNIAPASTFLVELEADEGRLYEYLEGVLLRGSGIPGRRPGSSTRTPLPSAITVYDLTVEKEWETIDVHTGADSESHAGEWEDDDGEGDTTGDTATTPSKKRRRIASAHPASHADEDSDEEIVIADGDDVESYTKHKWFPDTDEFPARSTKTRGAPQDISIKDIAMDPGNDLFLVARTERVPSPPGPLNEEGEPTRSAPWEKLHIHCLSLATFAPHPWACNVVSGVQGGGTTTLEDVLGTMKNVGSLVIQQRYATSAVANREVICMAHQKPNGGASENSFGNARIVCWDWHTGQKIFENTSQLLGQSLQTIEDFLILSSKIFAISVFSATRVPEEEGEGFDHATQLVIYGLAHNDRHSAGDKRRSSHEATELLRFELPAFNVIPGITMRADPPPRPTFPKVKPLMMYPKPETGLLLFTFDCGFLRDFRPAYYTLFILKETLLRLIPAEAHAMIASPRSDSTLRDGYRAPPTIPFERLAPYCRLKNDIEPQNWVTFIYHYRFVSYITRDDAARQNPFIRAAFGAGNKYIRLNDFDPVAAKKVMMTRKWGRAIDRGIEMDKVRDGDVEGEDDDGVDLVVSEDVIDEGIDEHVTQTYRTGSKFPYVVTKTQKAEPYSGVMIDDSRIVTITVSVRAFDDGKESQLIGFA
ncbi:hypothetical protein QFC22_001268 [Naganishia vaughanmartiniae]|uniref:Uncharacterized protein n=1 Tax=Naganishia vaughanmartiniae TaxID=1424756 RepID=A0ACC2XHG8_9TREE|nr:hypothetical protein QFC22_001268 [Naganishia vaughanmartiniae]